jgi:prophage tail gpP-like protein
VPRSFLHPGKRVRLHPDDYYAYGLDRGGIDERWFASTTEAAKKRAGWEATVRAARAGKLSVKVQGWSNGTSGGVWAINELVAVKIPSMRVNGDMLVSGVQFDVSLNGGTVTTLELVRPDAYKVEPDEGGGGGKVKAKTPYTDLWDAAE